MIKQIKCDVFESGADFILHQVNCCGVMGSGVALQVKEDYPNVYREYKLYCLNHSAKDLLGQVLYVNAECGCICNMFSQAYFGSRERYTDYDAFRKCLEDIAKKAKGHTIAMPYLIGCVRGGGDWNVVYKIIEDVLGDYDVTICEYNGD